MNGLNPSVMEKIQQLIQQNAQLRTLIQQPDLIQKLQGIASNPTDSLIAQQYASDPDIQHLIYIIGQTSININQNTIMPTPFFDRKNYLNSEYSYLHSQLNEFVISIHSEKQFYEILTKSENKSKIIISKFYAIWCKQSSEITPEFQRFAKLYKNSALFIKIDVDKNRQLSQKNKISTMPTFHFYKNAKKIDKLCVASSRKLEELITKHISNDHIDKRDIISKPSPYSNFPLKERNRPIYTKAPFKKMKDKLLQLNNKFISEQNSEYFLNQIEWNLLVEIVNMLSDRNTYKTQKFKMSQYKLLHKLLTWPSDTLPPVLDLIRVLSLHPSFIEYCQKNFDKFIIKTIIKIGGNGLINAVNGMLTCRIIINLFNRRIMRKVFENNYNNIIDNLILNCMVNEKKNTRLAFVRVLLHFSYCFYISKEQLYKQYNKIRLLSLFEEILYRENDINIILNILMGIGTLIFRDINVIKYIKQLDMIIVFKSYVQKYKNNIQIVNCCNELIKAIENPQL